MSYELGTDSRGRARAKKVSFSDEDVPSTYSSAYNVGLLMLAASFLFFISATTLAGTLPLAVLGIYLIVSTVTFFAYALDKSAARNDRWRNQESTLHLFALLGGWPGALAAQRLFCHKSKKESSQIVFWITVDRIDGVVITFSNITAAKKLEAQLRQARPETKKRVKKGAP